MKNWYRICLCLLISLLVPALTFGGYTRQKFVQDDWKSKLTGSQTVDPAKLDNEVLTGEIAGWSAYQTDKLNWILKFPARSEYSTPLWYALRLIQISINWILWILATVALIYMLYCWFLVFSSWADDKNSQKGRKWISTAAIALAWIGLSWLVVSAMIWFINNLTGAN